MRLDILLIEGLRIENGTRTSMSYNQILPSITESNGKPVSSEEGDSASKTETSLETMIDKNNNDTGKSTLYAGFYAGIKDQLAYHRASSSGYFILTNSPYPTVYTDELLNKGFIIPYRTTQENAPMSVEGESMKLDIISNSYLKVHTIFPLIKNIPLSLMTLIFTISGAFLLLEINGTYVKKWILF